MREGRSEEGSSSHGGDGKCCGKAPQRKKDGDLADKETCWRCGKIGHWAQDCKNPMMEKEEAHLV